MGIGRSFGRAVQGGALLLGLFSAGPATADGSGKALLERGTYLMRSIAACGNCHTPQGPDGPVPGMELAGGLVIEEPGIVAHTANITPDPETGIGRWSDAELITAIREGRRPDGSMIGPVMPIGMYRGLSDRDVRAIVAYLRSVPPVRNAVPASRYDFPLPASYGPPVGQVPEPPREDPVAYGAYLAGPVGHCIECHTPMAAAGGRDFETRLGAGGFPFPGPWGISVARNITSHPKDGLGAWSDLEIKHAIMRGISRDGTPLMPPMPFAYYAKMVPEDLDAIVAYLKSLEPLPSEAP